MRARCELQTGSLLASDHHLQYHLQLVRSLSSLLTEPKPQSSHTEGLFPTQEEQRLWEGHASSLRNDQCPFVLYTVPILWSSCSPGTSLHNPCAPHHLHLMNTHYALSELCLSHPWTCSVQGSPAFLVGGAAFVCADLSVFQQFSSTTPPLAHSVE